MRQLNPSICFFEFEVSLGLGITFPTRSVVIDLGEGKKLVISPGPFDPPTVRDLEKSSELLFVAPNAFHHLYLGRAIKAFPRATVFAPQGVFKKQKNIAHHFRPIQELASKVTDQILLYPIYGNTTLDETGFWHPSTRTLILTDLFFNMKEPMPMTRRWVLKLVGAYQRVGQSLLVRKTTRDRKMYTESVNRLIDLQPETIVIAHGDVVSGQDRCLEVLHSLV